MRFIVLKFILKFGCDKDALGEALQARTVAGGNSFPMGGVTGRRRSRRGRALPAGGASLRAAEQGGGGRGGEEDELRGALQVETSVAGGSCFPAGVVTGRRRSRRARAGALLSFPLPGLILLPRAHSFPRRLLSRACAHLKLLLISHCHARIARFLAASGSWAPLNRVESTSGSA